GCPVRARWVRTRCASWMGATRPATWWGRSRNSTVLSTGCIAGERRRMYSEVRVALVLLAVALAAFPAWLAGRIFTGNMTVLAKWQPADGKVVALASREYVEVELG